MTLGGALRMPGCATSPASALVTGSCAQVGGVVSVSIRKPRSSDGTAPESVGVTPTPTTTFGTRGCVLHTSAGASHYAVVARELKAEKSALATSLLAAAKRTSATATGDAAPAPSPPSSNPTRPRGVLYTAGYGYLGHDPAADGSGKSAAPRFDAYVCVQPQAVGGLLADEGELLSMRRLTRPVAQGHHIPPPSIVCTQTWWRRSAGTASRSPATCGARCLAGA